MTDSHFCSVAHGGGEPGSTVAGDMVLWKAVRVCKGEDEMVKMSRISTRHGEISYWDCAARGEETGAPVLFVHGNSSSSKIFDRQTAAVFAQNRRLLALDLPGHGASSDAPDPVATYAMDGFAETGLDLLSALNIEKAVLVGWSLGGHIVLEMAAQWSGVTGVVIVGTPPIGSDPHDLAAAFLPSDHMELTFKAEFSEAEARAYARETVGAGVPLEPWMVEGARRADGRFRPLMIESAMAGRGRDQKEIVATLGVPLAVLHAANDPFINLDYLKRLPYANLWRGAVQEMSGLGHAPFREDPERFNALLEDFLRDVA